MELYTTDPLLDGRWEKLSAEHPGASVFHQRGWLEALRRTYGYTPIVLTSSPPGEPLRDGIVLCRVSSWATGTRAVSLPFTDHCEPLLDACCPASEFANWLRMECDRQRWKYVEIRPLSWDEGEGVLQCSQSYCMHTLDLTRATEQIFQGLHKDSIQRRIRRAEREGLGYETGRGQGLLDDFYHLMVRTRKRHGLIPQPRAWFRNLVDCMGDRLQIRLARKQSRPIAAILTLRNRGVVTYKYGCSDEKFHNLGGMPFLFWKLIEESREAGAEELDFGKSDLNQKSLITFKERFGSRRRLLHYFRYPRTRVVSERDWRAVRQAFSMLPVSLGPVAGRLLYRHLA